MILDTTSLREVFILSQDENGKLELLTKELPLRDDSPLGDLISQTDWDGDASEPGDWQEVLIVAVRDGSRWLYALEGGAVAVPTEWRHYDDLGDETVHLMPGDVIEVKGWVQFGAQPGNNMNTPSLRARVMSITGVDVTIHTDREDINALRPYLLRSGQPWFFRSLGTRL